MSDFGQPFVGRRVRGIPRVRGCWPVSQLQSLKYALPITWRNKRNRLPYRRQEEEPQIGPDGQPEFVRVRLPRKKDGEIFGIADQLLGASRIKIMCADGKYRMGRIPGKIKKRMWIREGDLVIVQPWEFQDEKANIQYRYTKTQAMYLSRKKMIPKSIDVF